MKNRKVKVSQPKKVAILHEETTNNQVNTTQYKHPSAHTKNSTNCTIHTTTTGVATTEKRAKNKKNSKNMHRQQTVQVFHGSTRSRTTRKPKSLAIPVGLQQQKWTSGQQSCREYCLVDQNFIPITEDKFQNMVQDMFSKTAESSDEFKSINYQLCQHQTKGLYHQKAKLTKKSFKSSKENREHHQQQVVQKSDKAISNVFVSKDYQDSAVEVATQLCEVGMQYSERKEVLEQKQNTEKQEVKQIVLQQQSAQSVKKEENQDSLSNILLKLEFTHLVDDNSFTTLPSHEKEHFTQLLQTVITKLKYRPQKLKHQLKPISFQAEKQDEIPMKQPPPQSCCEINNETLKTMIEIRQSQQFGEVQETTEFKGGSFDSTLGQILYFLTQQLFCHIELHYSEEFVYQIKNMYGLPYRQKYKRITRNLPLSKSNSNFKVVEDSIFEEFITEYDGMYNNYNEVVHLKAVFDAFNQHIDEYRPFYIGNGEQFPWTFKMFATISEYSIDEGSLQIIFGQALDKIKDWCMSLCGIYFDFAQPSPLPSNVLELARLQRQNKMMENWVKEQPFEKDQVECMATLTLHSVAEDIYQHILMEVIQDITACCQ